MSARLLNSREENTRLVWSERVKGGDGDGLAGFVLSLKMQANIPSRAFTGNH